MALPIQFSDKDLLRNTLVEPAWYRVRLDEVSSKLSKDKQSTNYIIEATIIRNAENGDEKFAGVPLAWNLNSKAMGFAVGLFNAIGVDEISSQDRYDLESIIGKDIEVYVENDTYEGRMLNRVNHKYRPLSN